MDEDLNRRLGSFENFLDAGVTKLRLLSAAVYIVTFEELRRSIIEPLESFFTDRWDADSPKQSDEYRRDVLSLDKSKLYASLYFLRDRFHAINGADIASYEQIKRCRNDLAHQLFRMLLSDGLPADFESCFTDMLALIRKIESWWFANFEMALNDDIPSNTDPNEVRSQTEVMLGLLSRIALSPEKDSVELLEAFRRLRQRPNSRTAKSTG